MLTPPKRLDTALIYEDHRFFAQAFKELLCGSQLFNDVYYFSSEKHLIEYLQADSTGRICLFLDFFIDKSNTMHLLHYLRTLPIDIRIIMVSSIDNVSMIKKILRQRIDGFLSKIDDVNEIKKCVAALDNKETYISPAIRELLIDTHLDVKSQELTTREIEVISLLSAGRSTSEVAGKLHLSIHTVMTHRKNLMSKIGVKNISQAIVYAIRAGLIENN